MKINFISLFLSFALISVSTYEFISSALIIEKSSIVIEESSVEKKLADKLIDDTYLLNNNLSYLNIAKKIIHPYKQKLYTFNFISPLVKPPISI